jgi:hypothetical protein
MLRNFTFQVCRCQPNWQMEDMIGKMIAEIKSETGGDKSIIGLSGGIDSSVATALAAQALGDKAGIRRYGSATVPMDETLVTVAVDLSGRPLCVWQVELPAEMLGTFNAPLAEEFWRAVSNSAACNLHVLCHHGRNSHHIIEGVFKAAARALLVRCESPVIAPAGQEA